MRARRAVYVVAGTLALASCGAETASQDSVGTVESPIWSNSWSDTGFSPAGRASASPWSGRNLTLFWRSSTNHIIHSWEPEGYGWQGTWDIASNAASDPSSDSWDNDRIDTVWRGTNGHLMHIFYNNGFSAVEDVGTVIPNPPAIAVWGTWFYSVFWRGSNNHLMHQWYEYPTQIWYPVEDFGNTLASDPAVMFRGTDAAGNGTVFDIFWRGTDTHLKHATMPYNGQWVPSPPEDLGGALYSGSVPTAAPRWNGTAFDVFWRDTSSHLRHRGWDVSTGWLPPDTIDGTTTLASSPRAMSWGHGRVDVFATIGTKLKQRTFSRTMEVTLFGQEQSNWCWATSGQMISRYWNREKSQCAQATHAFGGNCCANPSSCNYGGLADLAWLGLQFTDSSATGKPITLDQVRAEVDAGRLWDHGIIWVGGGAHDVTMIDAFWFDNDWWVVVNDPSPQGSGSTYIERYSEYYNGTPGVSIGDWDFYQIRP
jgi:hypothetical protein